MQRGQYGGYTHYHAGGGLTYFCRRGFSINEGAYPNIHIGWTGGFISFYCAIKIWRGFRASFNIPLHRRTVA